MTNRATVTINTDADRAKVARWAEQTNIGTVVEFRKKSRSTEQNAKLHAMLSEVSEQVDWYGRKLTPTDWKNMFTASLQKANVVPGIDAGTVVTIGVSTSAMTVDEMSNLIELIYHFGAQPEHPVIFKDPHPGEDAPSSSAGDESGANPASSQDAADVRPSQSVASTIPDSSPTTGSAESTVNPSPNTTSSVDSSLFAETELSPVERALLIECCAKFMSLTVRADLDPPGRRAALETAKNAWKSELGPHLHQKMASMFLSADAVIRGKVDRAGAINEFADWLGCKPSEIGGAA